MDLREQTMEYRKLKTINDYIRKSVNPAKSPDTLFEMYSVPIFETGHPEYLLGREIASNKTVVQKNDILLCKINPRINRVWIVADESENPNIASSEWIVVRSSKYNPEFLAWYFRSPRFKNLMTSEVTGIGGSLTRAQPKSVAEYPVPVLEKPEQDAIAIIFNTVDTIIKKRRKQLQKLDELVKARFVELFGDLANPSCLWETIKLVDACASADDIKCGPFGTQLGKGEYVNSGVAVWEIPQINAAFKACPTHFITEEKATQLRAYSLVPGDIAMSRKGNVGRCAIFPDEYVDGIIHSDVLRIRVNKQKVNPVFMMYQLHFSNTVLNQIEMVSSGAIMAGVNVTKLKQIYVHIPPKKLQDQFALFVKQADKSKVAVQKALDEAQLLFDSLMQKYFE